MNCVQCAREIDNDSVFCRFCGAPVQPSSAAAKRLTRLPAEGSIAGVCAGLAAYFAVDVTMIRLAWILLSLVPGGIIGGIVAYVLAWAIIPAAPGASATVVRHALRRSTTDVQIAGVCGGIAEYLNADSTVVRVIWVVLTVIPGAIVLGVLAYLVAWAIMPRGDVRPLQHAPTPTI